MHNYDGKADVLVAIDQLLNVLPNIEWVAVVVTWFATSTDAGSLHRYSQGGISRHDAGVACRLGGGRLNTFYSAKSIVF